MTLKNIENLFFNSLLKQIVYKRTVNKVKPAVHELI